MSRISIEGAGNFSHHYPRLAAIVSAHARGRDNCMAAAWHSSISVNPPLFGVSIAPKRLTLELILEAGEFGVNFMPIELAELVAAVGGISGREVHKFQRFKIAQDRPLKTSVPVLSEAYAAYECRMVDQTTYGDHVWLVGEIVATHYDEDRFDDRQQLRLDCVSPALYMAGDLYTIPAKDDIKHLDRKVYGKS